MVSSFGPAALVRQAKGRQRLKHKTKRKNSVFKTKHLCLRIGFAILVGPQQCYKRRDRILTVGATLREKDGFSFLTQSASITHPRKGRLYEEQPGYSAIQRSTRSSISRTYSKPVGRYIFKSVSWKVAGRCLKKPNGRWMSAHE